MMITENGLGDIEVNGIRDQGQILWSADVLKKEEEVSMDTSLMEFGSKGKERLCAQWKLFSGWEMLPHAMVGW